MLNKYRPILSVEQETIVENVNLASNRDYNHDAIIWIYMEQTRRCCSSTSMETPHFYMKI